MARVNPRPLSLAVILFATVLATAAGAASPPSLAGCVPGAPATVRPKKIIVACGDANFYFTNLSWSSWNAKHAIGSGIATVNDCKPNCAAGEFHTYRSTITLSRPKSCAGGQREFTRMAWRFPATFPAGIGRAGSQSLPCR
jgi:hypothetical protein